MSRVLHPTRRAVLRSAGLAAAAGALSACASRPSATPAESYPPIGRFTTVEGVRLHAFEAGPPEAPAVVLIHGASGNVRDFTFSFVERLTPRYRVLAIDRPGFGHSERGPGGGSLEDAHHPSTQARLMRGAAQAFGVERAVVLGHSLGCAPALAWAIDAPQSVAGVVDLAGVTHPWPGSAGFIYDVGAGFAGGLLTGLVELFVSEERAIEAVDGIFKPQPAPKGYGAYVGVGLALRPRTFRANSADIALLKPILREQRRAYPKIAAPIEIVHGTADEIVPAQIHAGPLAEAAPTANLTLLDGVGHMPHHVAAEACVAAIDRAWARAEA